MNQPIPLLEFDDNPIAVYNPGHMVKPIEGMPNACVLCFFYDVINDLHQRGEAVQIGALISELGPNPIYRVEFEGKSVALVHPGVGAPMAAFVVEEMLASGAKTFVACGGAGVLDAEVAVGHLVVPTSAVRDEGTSYHYLPAGEEAKPDITVLAAIEHVLTRHNVDYRLAKTWTTDGIYRETASKVARRRDEGCATVEMEAAAFFAVGQFRSAGIGQILYGGDDVSGIGEWDRRGWDSHGIREDLLWLAVESCLEAHAARI